AAADDGRPPRTYRVNQILDLEGTDERFERPSTFDLPTYWREDLSPYRARLYQGEAVGRVSPRAVTRPPGPCGAEVTAAVRATGTKDATGWVTATVPIESLVHAEGQFLRFGDQVEVVRPVRLRNRLASVARGLADLYR